MKAIRLMLAFGALLAVPAFAGDITSPTTIAEVLVRADGVAFVRFAVNNPSVPSGSPSCARTGAFSGWYAFDASSAGGKALLSTILSAKFAGKSVTMFGTGFCTTAPPANSTDGVENIFGLRVTN